MSEVYVAPTGIIDIPHDRETLTGLSQSEKLTRINPLDFKGWNDLLLATPGHCFFHTANWARVLSEAYGYEPHYYVRMQDGKLALLISFMQVNSRITGRRAVCLPFSDYCEPVMKAPLFTSGIFEWLLEEGQGRGWKSVEFRGGESLKGVEPYSSYYQHVLSLEGGEERIFSNLRRNNRSNLKKSFQNNLQVRLSDSLDAVRKFYRLQCITRKKHGVPPQPFAFFEKIHKHIIAKKMGSVLLAIHKEIPIAGAIYFYFGNRVIHKFAASDEIFRDLHGNSRLTWEIICWSCQNGYRELCFGRSAMNNPGLIQYKDGWRAERRQLDYYKYDVKTASFLVNKKKSNDDGYYIFKKMPIPLLKIAGSMLYRHIG